MMAVVKALDGHLKGGNKEFGDVHGLRFSSALLVWHQITAATTSSQFTLVGVQSVAFPNLLFYFPLSQNNINTK